MKAALLALLVLLTACGPSDMAEQARIDPHEPDGSLPPPPGTVARDQLGRALALAVQPATDAALVARGRDRFAIFCAPCHGRGGDGIGRVPTIPPPPSLLDRRLTAEHMVNVMGDGFGAMPAPGPRLAPHDRWAVAAYIESLRRGAP